MEKRGGEWKRVVKGEIERKKWQDQKFQKRNCSRLEQLYSKNSIYRQFRVSIAESR